MSTQPQPQSQSQSQLDHDYRRQLAARSVVHKINASQQQAAARAKLLRRLAIGTALIAAAMGIVILRPSLVGYGSVVS